MYRTISIWGWGVSILHQENQKVYVHKSSITHQMNALNSVLTLEDLSLVFELEAMQLSATSKWTIFDVSKNILLQQI